MRLAAILLLATLAGASNDSLALSRFRADSAQAERIWFQGDSLRAVAYRQGDSIRTALHGMAQGRLSHAAEVLQRDTAKAAR